MTISYLLLIARLLKNDFDFVAAIPQSAGLDNNKA
jgi:hypothetical protein